MQMTLEITPAISIGKAFSPSHITGFYSEVKDESILESWFSGGRDFHSQRSQSTVELYR